jgi:hypothetical protein
MSNELYLQKLRGQYIEIGESYVSAVKKGKTRSELREIVWSIRSVLTEIKAVEQDLKRKVA